MRPSPRPRRLAEDLPPVSAPTLPAATVACWFIDRVVSISSTEVMPLRAKSSALMTVTGSAVSASSRFSEEPVTVTRCTPSLSGAGVSSCAAAVATTPPSRQAAPIMYVKPSFIVVPN